MEIFVARQRWCDASRCQKMSFHLKWFSRCDLHLFVVYHDFDSICSNGRKAKCILPSRLAYLALVKMFDTHQYVNAKPST